MKILQTTEKKPYVQCFDCPRTPILPIVGAGEDISARLEATAVKHERRHPTHDVTIFAVKPAVPDNELPIVREMRERFLSVQNKSN